jgi:hypothetical protein
MGSPYPGRASPPWSSAGVSVTAGRLSLRLLREGPVGPRGVCGRDIRGGSEDDWPGGVGIRGSWGKETRGRGLHNAERGPRRQEVQDGHPSRPGAAVETRRRPVQGGRTRRLLPSEAKTLRPRQVTLPNRGTLVPAAGTELRPVTRTMVVYKVPPTCGPRTSTTGTLRHFVFGRPLRSATNRPWGHSGEPGRCRTGGPGNSRALWETGVEATPHQNRLPGKHSLELLGIVADTRRQLYLLSPSKLAKISQAARLLRLKAIRHKRRCGLRDIQRFCGLGNSVYLAVTDARLHLGDLFDCASAATPSRRVTLCHQSLRDLAWWGSLPTNVHVGRGIWDASPSATLVTDASMEGWGAVLHAQTGNENTPSGAVPQTRAGVHQTFGTSVPV